MRVDVGLEPPELRGRRLALGGHRTPDVREAGSNVVIDGEETPQVDVALERHRDAVERDPEVIGVQAVPVVVAQRRRKDRSPP